MWKLPKLAYRRKRFYKKYQKKQKEWNTAYVDALQIWGKEFTSMINDKVLVSDLFTE